MISNKKDLTMKSKPLIYTKYEGEVLKTALEWWASAISVESEPQDLRDIKVCQKLIKKIEKNNEKI